MRRILLCCILTLVAWMSFSQDKQAYQIFTSDGEKVDYGTMIKALAKADIVFVGETHNCPIAHWLEYEIASDLIRKNSKGIALGAEMLERDNQLLVDEYVSGLITSDRFESEAKIWDNHYTDYSPLLYLARVNKVPFVATNVPRRYASLVKEEGLDALMNLSAEAKKLIAPLPIAYDRSSEDNEMFGFMNMMGGDGHYAEAQAVKDATMAWSIAENFERKFIHFNGNFHSDFHGGIIPYLNLYLPGKSISVIACVRQEEIKKLSEENEGRADFIICVPEEMTMTF